MSFFLRIMFKTSSKCLIFFFFLMNFYRKWGHKFLVDWELIFSFFITFWTNNISFCFWTYNICLCSWTYDICFYFLTNDIIFCSRAINFFIFYLLLINIFLIFLLNIFQRILNSLKILGIILIWFENKTKLFFKFTDNFFNFIIFSTFFI